MLPIADGRELRQLAAVDQERDAGVAEPERCEPRELLAQWQPELAACDGRVDRRARMEILVGEDRVGMCREVGRERLDVLGPDRQPRRRTMAAEALEVPGARGER